MSLILNLRHIECDPLSLEGVATAKELDLEGLDDLVQFSGPVAYRLEAERQEQGILIRGTLRALLRCECARCLRPFEYPLALQDWSVLVLLEGEEAAPVNGDCVDLTPYVREDIVLAFPQRPLCEPECGGLSPRPPGKPSESGSTPGRQGVSAAWAELNRLKF